MTCKLDKDCVFTVTRGKLQRMYIDAVDRITYLEGVVDSVVRVQQAIDGGTETFANQGQPMDGISALANFRGIVQDVIKEAENG